MLYLLGVSFVIILILLLFLLVSKKDCFDLFSNSTFECGFTSYFFSRFSFSIHYFMIGLIFLFLDLELSYLMPFLNEEFSHIFIGLFLWIFVMVLVLGLLEEWGKDLLNWKF